MSAQQSSLQDGSDRTVSPVRLLWQQNPDPLVGPRHPCWAGSCGLTRGLPLCGIEGKRPLHTSLYSDNTEDHYVSPRELSFPRVRGTAQPAPLDEHARKEYRNEL
jgi:hypothetical protein